MSCFPDPSGVLYSPRALRAATTGFCAALGVRTSSASLPMPCEAPLGARGFAGFLRPPCWGEFQLQPIHNLLRRVALVRPPFDQATLKRRADFVGIFRFTVDRLRQPRPAAQWPCRTRIA